MRKFTNCLALWLLALSLLLPVGSAGAQIFGGGPGGGSGPGKPGSEAAPPGLWLATSTGVIEMDRSNGAMLREVSQASSHAVAVDEARERLWYVAGNQLSKVTLNGVGESAAVSIVGAPTGARLAVAADSGTVWLAAGQSLKAINANGVQVLSRQFVGSVLGPALDPGSGPVWVADGLSLEALDRSTGATTRTLSTTSAVTGLAYDGESEVLWVATANALLRFGESDVPEMEVNVAGLSELRADGFGGVWAVQGRTVLRFALGGAEEASVEPFPADSGPLELKPEAATGSLWATDGRVLVRLSAGGKIQQAHDLGAEVLRDLDPGPLPLDEEGPELSIDQPLDGAVIEGDSVAVHLSWSDAGAGVDEASLQLLLDGQETGAVCSASLSGPVCTVYGVSSGSHTLTATLQDYLGNEAIPDSITFSADGEPGTGGGGGGFANPAQNPPGTDEPDPYRFARPERGLNANRVYVSDDQIETISTSTGNLTLAIPLGQVYNVGSQLSYQLQVVHNGSVWQRVSLRCSSGSVPCPPGGQSVTMTVPNPTSNAGLGWSLHFGRLFPVTPPQGLSGLELELWPNDAADLDPSASWVYEASDGSQRVFHTSLPGRPDNPGAPGSVQYTKDGSHLRLRRQGSQVTIDHPDGLQTVFKKFDGKEGTLFCGDGVTGCWRFFERKDRYGNRVWVDYQDIAGDLEEWKVRDSTGRHHTLTFSHNTAFRGGGDADPQSVLRHPNGDEWGDLRRILQKVEVAAFGNQQARYTMDYRHSGQQDTPELVARKCPQSADDWAAGEPTTLRTRVLHRILNPILPSWKIETVGVLPPGNDGCLVQSGLVSEVGLPSGGRLKYTYTNWSFPTRCDFRPGQNPDIDPPIRYQQPGVGTKRRLSPSGGLVGGPWTYSSSLQGAGSLFPYGPSCDREKVRKTSVRGPSVDGKYDLQVFYTAVAEGPGNPSQADPISSWQIFDHGLPFTKNEFVTDTNGDRVFLSREVFQCPASGSCGAGHKERSVYVRYATEWARRCNKNLGMSPECFRADPTLMVERTVYHDDADRYREKRFDKQNGLGFSRKTVEKDSFSSGSTATQTTDYFKGHPSGLGVNRSTGMFLMGNPATYYPGFRTDWILHPHGEKKWTERGRTYVRQFQFNNKGALTCERRMLSASRNARDVVVRYDLGSSVGTNAGLPILETWSGGDLGQLSTASLCSVVDGSGAADYYTISHEYDFLTLSKSRVGPASFPNTYRATIDRNTGLESITYSVAEQATVLSYDKLGRLTEADPAASLQAGTTYLFHTDVSGTRPSVKVEQRALGGGVEAVTTTTFDFFGRLYEKKIRRPNENGHARWSKQQWLYDLSGRLEKETTLQSDSDHSTLRRKRYSDYDPFGRARSINSPDNKTTRFVYFGDRKVDRTSSIAMSLNAQGQSVETDVKTTTFYDARGRMLEEHAGRVAPSYNPLYRMSYTYDPMGQMTVATRFANGTGQTRSFGQDGRGFLTSETHPELGTANSASGTITYKVGALGQRIQRWDGIHRLYSEYDAGGRKTRMRESSRTWAEWAYGTSTSGPNRNRGKLISATRHNYLGTPPNNLDDWKVTELYRYEGALGQLSHKETRLDITHWAGGSTTGPRFAQTWQWDSLGRLASQGYPQCTSGICNGSDDAVAPGRNVDWQYEYGLPTSVVSTEAGVSVPSQTAAYLYHANLQIATATYSNNTVTEYSLGTEFMPRPRRIRVLRSGVQQFDTGYYDYDGEGNIKSIGTDRYLYDPVSRLVHGTVRHSGAGRSETNTFDGFDNLVRSDYDGSTDEPSLYFANRKNRMLGGRPGLTDTTYDVAGRLVAWDLFQDHPGNEIQIQYDPLGMQTSFKRDFLVSQDPDEWFQRNYVDIYGPGNLRIFSWYNEDGSMVYTLRDLAGKAMRTWQVGGPAPGNQFTFDKDYVFGPEGMFASYGNGGALRFFHADHLGTPRVITQRFGAPDGRHNYYPFGGEAVTATSGYDDRMAKFTGHERDRNGGTDYMLGRTYLFPVKRFSTVDPGRDGWNLYGYGAGNPVKYVDLAGEEAALTTTLLAFAAEKAAGAAVVAETAAAGAAAGTAAGVATGAFIGVGLGYAVNQIPGVSEALTIPAFSDALSEGILLITTRNQTNSGRPNTAPPPTAIPGAKPKTTPAPKLTPGDPNDKEQPPQGDELFKKGIRQKEKTRVEKLVDVLETVLDAAGEFL